jgi:ferrous iron transport protein B
VQFGPQASNLGRFMSPAQLFVYAVVVSVSVPCIATFAALRAEHGWRPALAMSAGSLGIALGAGGVLARVLGAA